MINLKSAIKVSEKMGRSSESVELTTKELTLERYANLNNPTIIRGKVKGKGYKCEFVFTNDPNKVKCFCECADFKFTFYKAINEKGGASKRIPKSDIPESKGTGVVRSITKPGLCKHLMALAETL